MNTYFWFRRDLRLEDNAGLYRALRSGEKVVPVFVFDKEILDKLEDKTDARVHFIHDTLSQLKEALLLLGSDLKVAYGDPIEVWRKWIDSGDVASIYTNRDYEPYALKRDALVREMAKAKGIGFEDYKDQVVFEKEEVTKDDGSNYTVFTPYSRKWKAKLTTKDAVAGGQGSYYFQSYPVEKYNANFASFKAGAIPTLKSMGFSPSTIEIPSKTVVQKIIKSYDQTRNFPAINGTSKLGIHFRFGTISIREKARKAGALNETFLNELIWRDFYSTILSAFPHVVEEPFRAKYGFIEWRDDESDFQKWCDGQTGYPIVDAGMRELNATGYMHNRVRMVVASFLTKHLLIHWKWGETYFAQKLLDFDLASNSGGWQWAAGCGTDAAPYFRIFNPYSQQTKFDKDFAYIKKWVPEYGTDAYISPIVEHKFARERCLATYKAGLAIADKKL